MSDGDSGVYEDVRRCFTELVRSLPPASVDRVVPATPEWTVHDVLAHVVGIATDLNAQRFPADDDQGGSAWAAAQVARGRGRSVAELLAAWEVGGPAFEAGLRLFGRDTERHFVGDLVTHLVDVAEALGHDPADLDLRADAVDTALEHYRTFVDERLAEMGLALPVTVASLPALQLLRLLSARRPLASVPGAEVLADVYDGSGYSFPA